MARAISLHTLFLWGKRFGDGKGCVTKFFFQRAARTLQPPIPDTIITKIIVSKSGDNNLDPFKDMDATYSRTAHLWSRPHNPASAVLRSPRLENTNSHYLWT
jgi:hypothetical protein